MTSCPNLVELRNVYLSAKDIVDGPLWTCSKLRCLDLTVVLKSYSDDKQGRINLENTLFQRVCTLRQLNHFSLSIKWKVKKSLAPESWKALSKVKTLTFLELRWGVIGTLNQSIVEGISKLKKLKDFHGDWLLDGNEHFFIEKIEGCGVSVKRRYQS